MTIVDHLNTMFGVSSKLVNESDGIQIRVWNDLQNPLTSVVCTVGMSDRAQFIRQGQGCPSSEPRIECFCFCRHHDVGLFANLLMDLASYPFIQQTTLFWWQTLDVGRSVATESRLDALLLTFPPYPSEQVTFVIGGARRDLVWVIPISESELRFCRVHGVDAFEDLLEANTVDVANIRREPIC